MSVAGCDARLRLDMLEELSEKPHCPRHSLRRAFECTTYALLARTFERGSPPGVEGGECLNLLLWASAKTTVRAFARAFPQDPGHRNMLASFLSAWAFSLPFDDVFAFFSESDAFFTNRILQRMIATSRGHEAAGGFSPLAPPSAPPRVEDPDRQAKPWLMRHLPGVEDHGSWPSRKKWTMSDFLRLFWINYSSSTTGEYLLSVAKDSSEKTRDRLEACDIICIKERDVDLVARAKTIIQSLISRESAVSSESAHLASISNSMEKTVSELIRIQKADPATIARQSSSPRRGRRPRKVGAEDPVVRCRQWDVDEMIEHLSCSSAIPDAEATNIKIAITHIQQHVFAAFTSHSLTLKQIFELAWSFIQSSPEPRKTQLLVRMRQELADMSGTCTQGYISRIINVFSGFTDTMGIGLTYEEEIYTIFSHRVEQAIQTAPVDIRDILVNQITVRTDQPQNRIQLLTFLSPLLPQIWKNIRSSYKTILSDQEFDLHYRNVVSRYDLI